MGQTLKGQNVRLLQYDATAEKYRCIEMATNLTVNLSANTEQAETKDDVGGAQKPTVTSKSAQISIETNNVTNAAGLLAAIKSMQPMLLLWDEVSTTDNQTPLKAGFARKCSAYLNDLSLTLNDRETCKASLQFQVSGAIEKLTSTPAYEVYTPSTDLTKGQFVRLFLGSDNTATPAAVLAASKSLTVHVSVQLEDATTKDTDGGDWQVQEPTGISFDISANALVRSGDTITSQVAGQAFADIQDIYEASNPVKFQVANVSGANQRTKGSVIMEGSVVISALNMNAGNRQNATYDATLTGYGDYTVGA